MTKIDVFSGFLGAGKTTLIKKLISEAYQGEKLVLIENEFGEIGIDGGFLKDAGIEITEMNSGCICCSLVGDFDKALKKVLDEFAPDRILIEPSGVGKLSDVLNAVKGVLSKDVILNSSTTVVDAAKCKMYMKNFGEFFGNQIENAGTIILSRTDVTSEEKIGAAVNVIREKNQKAVIITTPLDSIDGKDILSAIEGENSLDALKEDLAKNTHCDCGHHHEHHHHDEHCNCGHHHEHHHADDVFRSWGVETHKTYSISQINDILESLDDAKAFGVVLRAKGYVNGTDGWIYFDYVPGQIDVRLGKPSVTGRVCVIGSNLDEDALSKIFII